ncbi:MAG TPA: tetratricopeptide repeat protein [Ktedonobacteraceae bacterium]|nr:tetratricopeptide repeat protein [Ktedonobacteraceae bacterium]
MTQRNGYSFSRQLKSERELRGWSQARLAELLTTDTKTVSRWERGVALPVSYYREKLSSLFDKTPLELGILEAPSSDSFLLDPLIPLPLAFPLIGRDEELALLRQRLCNGDTVALSALNGLPGVGKTALSITLAHDPDIRAHFKDGILWAGLGPEANIQGHLSHWGSVLGLSESETSTLKDTEAWSLAIHRAIGERSMLLVIDDAWTLEAPLALKVGGPYCAHLITTRFPGIASQVVVEGAMAIKELNSDQGMVLLQMLAPQVVEKEPRRIRELVEVVGGLPLALTLIGNYLRMHSYTGPSRRVVAALQRLSRAEERLNVSEVRAPFERHPSQPGVSSISLSSVIAVTDQQLDSQARQAFYSLAVFPAKPNSFSEEAALAVAACSTEVLDILIDTGLLQSGAADRYTLHQTIADYARLQLKGDEAHKRFVSFLSMFVQEHSLDYETLEIESNNILAALDVGFDMALPADLIGIVCAFAPFLLARGLYEIAETHLQRALTAAKTFADPKEMRVLMFLGEIVQRRGHFVQAEEYYGEGLTLARQGQASDQVMFLSYLGSLSWKQGKYAEADTYLQEGLLLARTNGQEYLYSILEALSSVAQRRGDYSSAEQYIRESIALYTASQEYEQAHLSNLLSNLGMTLVGQRRLSEAEQTLKEGLEVARKAGHREWTVTLLNNIGDLKKNLGDYVQANTYLQEGLEVARHIGHLEWQCVLLVTCGETARRQGLLEQANAYLQEGMDLAQEVGIPQMMALALSEQGQIALLTGNLMRAEQCFQEMRAFIPDGDRELLSWINYDFAQLASARGNIKEARRLAKIALAHRTLSTEPLITQWLTSLSLD